jgi:phenylalanyl-tRNA synthetase beta chain
VKVVLNWLRELCPTDLPAEDLADLLTSKGAEVESIERPWERLSGVVVARVIEVRDHPDSDTLCVARVQTGSGELEVVVGVRNMGPGDLIPLAGPGATVLTLDAPLAAREIRGVVSNGMLCAPDEVGVSPSHEGILILPPGLEPGADVAEAFDLRDAVLDVEVTPNRPDFLSVLGIAREVSAATGIQLMLPNIDVPEADEQAEGVATLEVQDLERCPRYLARIIRDVRHVDAPIRAQARLFASGMRPLSAVVDATNYAMLEIGQPLHPFDLPLLKGPGILVRRAKDGETLVTLDGAERTFTTDDLLICDAKRAVAVAGVMGGELAEVSDQTAEVLLESASFEREGVQRTRRRIDLSTEASMRFERGVDPEAAPIGASRAARLMTEWCGATVLRGVIEVGGPPPRRMIELRASRTSTLSGYPVSVGDAIEVFDRLGIGHETLDEDHLRVEVPGYRVDLEREVDLIEEVVRIQGYDRVGSTLPPIRQPGGTPAAYEFRSRVRDALRRAGLREVRAIPFVSEADLEVTREDDAIRVANPLQADDGWLRTRLLPGLLKAAGRNVRRHVRSVALFEVGTVFRMREGRPAERSKAALVLSGHAESGWSVRDRPFDVFDAKGAVEALLAELGVAWALGPSPGRPFHPGRSATVLVGGERVGVLGELHPKVAERYDLTERVAVAELEVEELGRAAAPMIRVDDVPRFPPVRRDLAFVVETGTPASAIQATLEDAGGDLVGSVVLFDVFEGAPLPEGSRSLAFSIDFRAPDRTLTDEEAEAAVAAIVERLSRDFGAQLRSG